MRSSSHKHAGGARWWRFGAVLLAIGLIPTFVPDLHTTSAQAQPKVVFRDDFNGTRLDASKWNASWFGSGNNPSNPVNGLENDCYDPHQVSVKNGVLILAAVPRSCLGHSYASGLVNTHGKFQFLTGIFSARVWLPGGGDNRVIDWPGVWTDGARWPTDGEVDLLEGLNGHNCWHVHTVRPTVGGCANSMGGGWHVVKYERTRTTLTFYYDGKKMGTESASLFPNSPHYLILNLAVSKVISPPERPAFMLVDWVQVRT